MCTEEDRRPAESSSAAASSSCSSGRGATVRMCIEGALRALRATETQTNELDQTSVRARKAARRADGAWEWRACSITRTAAASEPARERRRAFHRRAAGEHPVDARVFVKVSHRSRFQGKSTNSRAGPTRGMVADDRLARASKL
jgi:hypothetical protein